MLYVLDEPSMGLHPRDIQRLIEAVRELREEFPHPYHWAPFVLIGRGGKIRSADPEFGS